MAATDNRCCRRGGIVPCASLLAQESPSTVLAGASPVALNTGAALAVKAHRARGAAGRTPEARSAFGAGTTSAQDPARVAEAGSYWVAGAVSTAIDGNVPTTGGERTLKLTGDPSEANEAATLPCASQPAIAGPGAVADVGTVSARASFAVGSCVPVSASAAAPAIRWVD